MARIFGIELPNKRVEIALTYVYGIGISSSRKVLKAADISFDRRANDLKEEEVNKISKYITDQEMVIGGDKKNQVVNAIKRLIQINCYRGMRHRKGLPVRGQRSQTNARTRKGRGKAIANKKKAGK